MPDERPFRSKVVSLASGAALGQAALILSSPFLSRIYTPEAISTYTEWFAIVAIAATFATFRWEYALPAAPTADRQSLLRLAYITATLSSILVFVWVLVDSPRNLGQIAYWLAPAVLIQCWYQIRVQAALCEGEVRAAGFGKSAHGVGQALAQVGGGLVFPRPVSLAIGYIISAIVGLLPMRKVAGRVPSTRSNPIGDVAARHWRASGWIVFSSGLNTLGMQLPIFILAGLNEVSAGQFGLGTRAVMAPTVLLGTAFTQVFMSQIAIGQSERAGEQVEATLNRLLVVLIVVFAPVAALGPQLTSAFFGPDWVESGQMLQILAPALLLVALSSAISLIPISVGSFRGEAIYQVTLLASRAILMMLGMRWGALGVVAGYSVASVLCLAGYTVWALNLVGGSWRALLRQPRLRLVAIVVAASLAVLAAVAFARWDLPDWTAIPFAILCMSPSVVALPRPTKRTGG